MPIGKLIAQTGHAFCTVLHQAQLNGNADVVYQYFENDQPKITKRAKNLDALERASRECQELGINNFLVTDAGRTVFVEPTVTCLGIGPIRRSDLPKYIEKMQLL